MIIRKLILINFKGFYGEHSFDFSKDLTIINARNGNGKSSLVEAISLLFKEYPISRHNLCLSAKKENELNEGDDAIVSIKLYFNHNGEKALERRIKIIKKRKDDLIVQTDEFLGFSIYDTQEIQVPYQSLLDAFTIDYIRNAVVYNRCTSNLDEIINYYGRQYAEFKRDLKNIESLVNMNLKVFDSSSYTHLNVKLGIIDNNIKVIIHTDTKDDNIIANSNYSLACIVGYSLLFSIKRWHEEITGKGYPIILDSPEYFIPDSAILELCNMIKNNHQVIMLTSAFFDYTKELDIDKLEQINCCSYYIRKDEAIDRFDLASVSFLEKKLF